MLHDALIDALPDLVALVRRDGVLLSHAGGHAAGSLRPGPNTAGQHLETFWPAAVATLVGQLIRRAISHRGTSEIEFQEAGQSYSARASAQGPDRALCVIRLAAASVPDSSRDPQHPIPSDETMTGTFSPRLDRLDFLRRFKESRTLASLTERALAVAALHVEGLIDISRLIDPGVADRVTSSALRRVVASDLMPTTSSVPWYLGQLSDSLWVIVIECAERERVEALVTKICANLRQPVEVGNASFTLVVHAGVAMLGPDATTANQLLSHARSAAADARRSGSSGVRFFSDTLQLRALARLDVTRELREAIDKREIGLAYIGRHDLATGQLVARVGYLRWSHPLRGHLPPAEFLPVAEATGLAAELSRSALESLGRDFTAFEAHQLSDLRISFGALRHHLLDRNFVADIERFLSQGAVPASRLELRITERCFVASEMRVIQALSELGVYLIVDEIGRGVASIDLLARAPLSGLQLDRSWVTAARHDSVALKVCRAGISIAAALGLPSIAAGVDDEVQRETLLALGCRQGMGDLYGMINPVPTRMPMNLRC